MQIHVNIIYFEIPQHRARLSTSDIYGISGFTLVYLPLDYFATAFMKLSQ
jgi:hypothetical protein